MARRCINKYNAQKIFRKEYYNFIEKLFNNKNIEFMDIENVNSVYVDDEEILEEEKKDISNIAIDINKVKVKKFSSIPELTFYNVFDFIKMENSDEGYFSYCSDLNHVAYRFQLCNKYYPSIYRFEDFVDSTKFINSLFEHYNVPHNSYMKISFQDNNESKISSFIIAFAHDLILFFNSRNSGALYYNALHEKDENSMLYTILGLMKNQRKPKITKNKIYIVYRNQHGFEKIGFDIKKIKIDLNENYNDGFVEKSIEIINGLNNKNKTNLVILSGAPGVGKTSFIRYLTAKLKKNIIFISPDMVDSITDPAFIPFLMKNNDSVLIIEDAEPALEKRSSGGRSSAVSNVLNLTDGLLSDCLKISIVATFNTDKKTLDEALLRRGRLLMNYKFDKLCVDKSKSLLEKLGHKEIKVTEPMTLADIYYYGTDNNAKQENVKKIGFLK